MTKKSATFLRVLINRFHQGPHEAVLELLPPNEREEVKSQPTLSSNVEVVLRPPQERLMEVHYSWYLPAMKKLPTSVNSLVLATLPDPLQSKLSEKLKKKPLKITLPEDVQAFILRMFAPYFIEEEDVLPIPFLPETPLTPLLELSKKQLLCLMDFLGILDLTPIVRNIVDKKVLETYQKCLTPKEKEFLNLCLHKKEKLVTPPLDLGEWDRDCKKLRGALHKRGLMRMAHALCGQHADFIWHLSRKLDTGRGTTLLKHAKEPLDPDVIRVLVNQIRQLLQYLNFKPSLAMKEKRGG